jgi:hypothetical protein
MIFLDVLARLLDPSISRAAIRSEIYFLGSRHQGEALAGALKELKSPDLDPGRMRLLRAVVADLGRPAPH